jgi:hypothetical protein
MTQARINRVAAILPLVFSAFAFLLVMANIVAGVPPQPDEDASAHIWQLLVGIQLPLILLFVVTADWRKRQAAIFLGTQIVALAIACAPVWLAGY